MKGMVSMDYVPLYILINKEIIMENPIHIPIFQDRRQKNV